MAPDFHVQKKNGIAGHVGQRNRENTSERRILGELLRESCRPVITISGPVRSDDSCCKSQKIDNL